MKKTGKVSPEDMLPPRRENCGNPWNGECGSTDIALYIFYKGHNLPICRSCWNEIAETDVEWRGSHDF